jgi:hypothetical protein
VATNYNKALLFRKIIVSLSPKKKHYLSMILLIVALAAFGFLAIQFNKGWAVGILVSMVTYAFWNMMFSCPVCGNPYLYEFNGTFVVPSQFPDECNKCGYPTGHTKSKK